MIRSKVVRQGNTQVNKMHKKSASLVKAQTQASMIRLLEPDLTKEELAIFKRGRNAKSVTMAKHATMAEYRMATGMEALVGYLYLSEQFERLSELISLGLKKIEERET
jgi:ribonuclease-3 family protein